MPGLISMKGTSDKGIGMPVSEESDYPYGLRVHLEDEQLDKLGVEMMPDPGAKRMLVAKVEIVSTNRHSEDGESRRSMALQITDMRMSEDVPDNMAERLYPTDAND